MENQLTAAELKRRGLVAIEEGLQRGPLYLVKHNKLTAATCARWRGREQAQPPSARFHR